MKKVRLRHLSATLLDGLVGYRCVEKRKNSYGQCAIFLFLRGIKPPNVDTLPIYCDFLPFV